MHVSVRALVTHHTAHSHKTLLLKTPAHPTSHLRYCSTGHVHTPLAACTQRAQQRHKRIYNPSPCTGMRDDEYSGHTVRRWLSTQFPLHSVGSEDTTHDIGRRRGRCASTCVSGLDRTAKIPDHKECINAHELNYVDEMMFSELLDMSLPASATDYATHGTAACSMDKDGQGRSFKTAQSISQCDTETTPRPPVRQADGTQDLNYIDAMVFRELLSMPIAESSMAYGVGGVGVDTSSRSKGPGQGRQGSPEENSLGHAHVNYVDQMMFGDLLDMPLKTQPDHNDSPCNGAVGNRLDELWDSSDCNATATVQRGTSPELRLEDLNYIDRMAFGDLENIQLAPQSTALPMGDKRLLLTKALVTPNTSGAHTQTETGRAGLGKVGGTGTLHAASEGMKEDSMNYIDQMMFGDIEDMLVRSDPSTVPVEVPVSASHTHTRNSPNVLPDRCRATPCNRGEGEIHPVQQDVSKRLTAEVQLNYIDQMMFGGLLTATPLSMTQESQLEGATGVASDLTDNGHTHNSLDMATPGKWDDSTSEKVRPSMSKGAVGAVEVDVSMNYIDQMMFGESEGLQLDPGERS